LRPLRRKSGTSIHRYFFL